MMRYLATLCFLLSATVGAQDRPHTTLVVLSDGVAEMLAREYTPAQERVWCVTSWDTTARVDYTLITVLDVKHVGTGEPNKISNSALAHTNGCPLIHSHSPGNCQASPADKETAVQRESPFDGILCGDRYTVWYFAVDIVAVENYRFLLAQQQLSAAPQRTP